jgi:hypothetical protein
MLAPPTTMHAFAPLGHFFVSLLKTRRPSTRSAKPRAAGGTTSPKDRKVPLAGSSAVPPAAVAHAEMARCSAAVSSDTPSPTAPKAKASHSSSPASTRTWRPL